MVQIGFIWASRFLLGFGFGGMSERDLDVMDG